MANFGNANLGFFSGGATGGGGGGISGSGTTNFVPKWASSTSLTDSLFFDNGTSVGLGTTTPNASFIFDVVGNTRASGFGYFGNDQVRINTSTSGYVDLYSSTERKMLIGDGATDVAGLRVFNGNAFRFDNASDYIATSLVNFTSQIINGGVGNNTHNVVVSNPILNLTGGTTVVRGFLYNPNLTATTGLTNIAFQNVSGDIIFGNLNDTTNLTTQVAMLDENGKVVRQSSLTSFNLYQSGATPDGISIDFATNTYIFGSTSASRSNLEITTDEFKGKYAGVNQGIYLDFSNYSYTFGQIDDGIGGLDVKHQVDGTSGSEIAYFQLGSNRIGYEFDFGATKTFKYGDVVGTYGINRIELDATNNTMVFKNDQSAGSTTFEANALIFTGANIEVGSPTASTTTYLKVTLNTVDYAIRLDSIA